MEIQFNNTFSGVKAFRFEKSLVRCQFDASRVTRFTTQFYCLLLSKNSLSSRGNESSKKSRQGKSLDQISTQMSLAAKAKMKKKVWNMHKK